MRVNESELNSTVLPRDPPAEGASRRPPWVTSTLAAILIFTIVVDLLGNLLVILSVYRNKKLRNAASSHMKEFCHVGTFTIYFTPYSSHFRELFSSMEQVLIMTNACLSVILSPTWSDAQTINHQSKGLMTKLSEAEAVCMLTYLGNVFVVSLAVADLVVAIYPYPLVLTSVFHNGWNLGYLHCQISGFLMGLSVIGSIFNITGIAINRYCYICHSLKYDKLYSDKNSLCYVVLIWVLTFVAIVPNLFVGSLQYDPRIYSCTFAQSVSSAYTIAVVFFHFLLPIAIVTFCYLRIWILVIQVRRRVKPDNNPRLKPHDFRNFVTMFVVFVLFAVCWAPLNFIGLAVAVNPETIIPRIPEWLFVSSYYMAYFNSCLNAIIYGLLNQNFRREYKRIIVNLCTANVFFQDSSNDAGDRMRSKPSPLITNNNQVKVDSV
ncbi:Mtnr1a [Columba livia]|nr:Mtnr1a [Columba livia]